MSISEFQITTDANKARMLFSRLMECEKSGARYLDSEMEASKVKIDFRPDMKAGGVQPGNDGELHSRSRVRAAGAPV